MMDTMTIAVGMASFLFGAVVGLTAAIESIGRRRAQDRLARIKRRIA